MNVLLQYLTVGAAGFAGAIARFGLSAAAASVVPGRPWAGTFVINVTGCFALGWFLATFGDRFGPSHPARLAVAVGFLGAYTTFSTFAHEADGLIARGAYAAAALYVGGNVGLGLLACAAGAAAGR